MYLSTELNQFPPTRVCAFYVFFGRLPWRIISAGRRPCSARFPSIHHLAAVCTGRQGGWCHLRAKPTKLYDTSFSGEIEIVPKKVHWDLKVCTQRGREGLCHLNTKPTKLFDFSSSHPAIHVPTA